MATVRDAAEALRRQRFAEQVSADVATRRHVDDVVRTLLGH